MGEQIERKTDEIEGIIQKLAGFNVEQLEEIKAVVNGLISSRGGTDIGSNDDACRNSLVQGALESVHSNSPPLPRSPAPVRSSPWRPNFELGWLMEVYLSLSAPDDRSGTALDGNFHIPAISG